MTGHLGLLLLAAGTFDADVLPLFRAKCFACHNGKTRSGGLSLESREDILRGGKSGGAIIPGKPVDSLLMTAVATGKMPMAGTRLNAVELGAIRTWIEREDRKAPVAERDVTAILSAKCWVCHGRREKMAGLDLRTRESMLRGGKSGSVLTPGKPEESLLVKRIGAQEMPPPKLQEQYSVRALANYGQPFFNKKLNANASLGGSYSQTPGLVNGGLNYARNPSLTGGVTLSSNISERLDFTLSSNSTKSFVRNTLNTRVNTNYFSQNTRLRLSWIVGPGISIQSDVSHQLYRGLSSAYNQNYALWNTYLAVSLPAYLTTYPELVPPGLPTG